MADDEMMERTDLSDLVRARMKENGQGFRTLADACIDPKNAAAGPQWTRSTLANLVHGQKIKMPGPEKVRALAAGLRLPERVVKEAVDAQFSGVTMSERWNSNHDLRVFIARMEGLDEEGVREILELAEVVLRRLERKALARSDSGQ